MHERHSAMINASRNGPDTCGLCQINHPLWPHVGTQVEVGGPRPQQRVSHTAANEIHIRAAVFQHLADVLRVRILQPVCAQYRHLCIRSAKPRSIRAVAPQM